jgi:hypothetical protein
MLTSFQFEHYNVRDISKKNCLDWVPKYKDSATAFNNANSYNSVPTIGRIWHTSAILRMDMFRRPFQLMMALNQLFVETTTHSN